jgi:integrase
MEHTNKNKLLPYPELKQRLNQIHNPTHRVCLKTIYAGCARVGEIMNSRYSDNPSLSKADIETSPGFLVLHILTEKRNTWRRVPISRIDDDTQLYFKKNEAWLSEEIIDYAKVCNREHLFNWSTRWAEQVFGKYFPEFNQHVHLLRHWRASHLLQGVATGVVVPERVVAKIGGWMGTKVLTSTYDNTIIEDYVRM